MCSNPQQLASCSCGTGVGKPFVHKQIAAAWLRSHHGMNACQMSDSALVYDVVFVGRILRRGKDRTVRIEGLALTPKIRWQEKLGKC